jgi:GT2 family glycosyltransferase
MLERLIASLQAQVYPAGKFEIIVVHNWTADGTEELVTSLTRHISFIAYYRKNNRSPTASRQFGAQIARGTIVAFIDDDCEADPRWIESGVAAMQPNIGIVQGRTIPRPDQPRRFFEKTVSITGRTPLFETCNIFYRRSAFLEVGGFSPEFLERFWGEDTDLGWKVRQAGWQCAFAENALVYHEIFAQSVVDWHLEALRLQAWPMLVKKWPLLRRELYCRYFLSRQSAAFTLCVIGIVLALAVSWGGLFLTLPYGVVRAIETGRFRNPLLVAARMLFGLPRAALIFCALAYGSIKSRRVVL